MSHGILGPSESGAKRSGWGRVFRAMLAIAPFLTSSALAGNIAGNTSASTGGLGNFTGQITVSDQTATSAVVTVTLTNTSPASNGGFITGFVLNNPGTDSGGNITGITNYSTTNSQFVLLGGPSYSNSVPASPFGSFDFGAALGGQWLGGGRPNGGIGVGQSDTFTFTVTGNLLLNLADTSLESANSTGGSSSSFFDVRFRGFKNEGSDKVPAMVTDSPVVPTPEPTTLSLGGLGLVMLLGYGWRQRRTETARPRG
jgi:PEP-CTERM motif